MLYRVRGLSYPFVVDSEVTVKTVISLISIFFMESLILAQDERWRRGLGMQVARETFLRECGQWRTGE